jgi:transposase
MPRVAIAMELNVRQNTVSKWCQRWRDTRSEDDQVSVELRLSDMSRPGTPPLFSAEQNVAIVAIGCQTPKSCGRPIEQWTSRELKDEVQKQGIVKSISVRHVGRILSQSKLQPHRVRCWLNERPDPEKEDKIKDVCEVYKRAKDTPEEAFLSVDEMTGIQALERMAKDKPMVPGKPRAIEFEYIRHGTTCLLGAWNIAEGTISGFCNPTRTEEDFLELIDRCVAQTPGKKRYHFVMDNLNTHQSESLVCYVAEMEGDIDKLGKKGESGLLKNMETRAKYLRNPSHHIVFHYTPKHASWLNQIEVWFGILVRKALRWASFASIEALTKRIRDFMDYFNRTMAKPFNWRYAG